MNLSTERCVEVMSELTPVIDRALRSTGLYAVSPFLWEEQRAATMPVFVGGSVVGLLVTDPKVHVLSPTKDIDLVIQVANRMEFCQVEAALRREGFRDALTEEKMMLGRFWWGPHNVVVEFLLPDPEITGFADRWYPDVLGTAIRTRGIWHAGAPAFLATKINAFLDGRRGDFTTSKDIEDMLAVIDGREEVVQEMNFCPAVLRDWVVEKIRYFLGNSDFLNALPGHVPDEARVLRTVRRLQRIIGS